MELLTKVSVLRLADSKMSRIQLNANIKHYSADVMLRVKDFEKS